MAKKVIGQTIELYKSVVLELYKRITAKSLQVGIQYGSPGGRVDKTVREPNPDGEESLYPGLPLTNVEA